MLLHRAGEVCEDTDGHHCVVAGRRTDGALADVWSDAQAYLDGCYVAYVPRCECGWTGPPFSTTASGYAACEQLWRDKHLQPFRRAAEPSSDTPLTSQRPIQAGTEVGDANAEARRSGQRA